MRNTWHTNIFMYNERAISLNNSDQHVIFAFIVIISALGKPGVAL